MRLTMLSLLPLFARALLVALAVCLLVQPGAAFARQVNVIRVESVISPSSADYIVTAIKQAEKDKVAALVIELDTPGGLDTSMRVIIKEMLAAERPIVVYVAPSGARAASAGAFITVAADIAAMAPGTNIGAAAPVAMGGQMDKTMEKKVTNDAAAYMRTIAEKRGRPIDLAEEWVRKATAKTETEALKAKIKKAMNYPIAVVLVAIIVSAILLIKVVPQFQDVFANFGAELPAFTLMVIGLSEALQAWWHVVLLVMFGAAYAFKTAHGKSERFRNGFDRFLLKIPVVGDILYKSAVARFARTLATTFAAGVPLVDALDSVAGATGNVVFRNATMKVKADVSSGMQLNFSMRTTGTFPSMAIQMTAIGEESGSLDEMLAKVATFYEDEVDNMVDGLTALMEPMIMAVLGVLVGGLIIAMYLPIFQLGAVV